MSTVARTALSLLLGLLSLPFCYLFAAIVLSLIATSPEVHSCSHSSTAWVSTNGVHLSLHLPVELVSDEILQGLHSDKPARYLSFGWGDSTFYVHTPEWSDLKMSVALKAMLCSTPAAMHVYFTKQKHDHWRPISLCPQQLVALNKYIFNSFEKNAVGRFIKMEGAAYGKDDLFYSGRGRYSLLYTSNNWVNQGLKQAGMTTCLWSPFDKGTLYQLKS